MGDDPTIGSLRPWKPFVGTTVGAIGRSATVRPVCVLVGDNRAVGMAGRESPPLPNELLGADLTGATRGDSMGALPTEGADGADRAGGAETRGAGIDPPRLDPEVPIGAALLPAPLPSTGTVPATAAPHESSSHATDILRNVFMARISRSESPRKIRVTHCFARLRISVSIRCSARRRSSGVLASARPSVSRIQLR